MLTKSGTQNDIHYRKEGSRNMRTSVAAMAGY